MKYVECPSHEADSCDTPVFLAGGITGCPDWQKEMVLKLGGTDLTLLNPRRAKWGDSMSADVEREQIEWEHFYLDRSAAILFWFPCETLCPIALYELGKWTGRTSKKLFIGCHPDYKRRRDVVIQTDLERSSEIEVVSDLNALAEQVRAWSVRVEEWRKP